MPNMADSLKMGTMTLSGNSPLQFLSGTGTTLHVIYDETWGQFKISGFAEMVKSLPVPVIQRHVIGQKREQVSEHETLEPESAVDDCGAVHLVMLPNNYATVKVSDAVISAAELSDCLHGDGWILSGFTGSGSDPSTRCQVHQIWTKTMQK